MGRDSRVLRFPARGTDSRQFGEVFLNRCREFGIFVGIVTVGGGCGAACKYRHRGVKRLHIKALIIQRICPWDSCHI